MSYLFSVDLALNLYVIVPKLTLYIRYYLQSEENEIIFAVGCAERDWVHSKVFTEKLDSYTRIFSRKQNKPPLSFQLQPLLVVDSLI